VAAPGKAFVASAAVAARFVPIWLATGVLMLVAAIIAPRTLQNTSWAYILPYMTVLAVAALGQMLVIMHAGIDLSAPGVISFGGNLIVGVSLGQDGRLALGLLACLALGAGVGLVNGILVGIVRLNPLIVTLAVGQIVAAWSLRYARENTNSLQVPNALSSWAAEKPIGISSVFWMGAGITIAVALLLRFSAAGRRFQAVGANPTAAWMAGLRVRTHVVFAYTAAGTLYGMATILLAGASLSGGLASATSTWVAALALTLLTQMLLILGLSVALQYIVFGAAIIAGMLISGDRVASLLGRLLRPVEATSPQPPTGTAS
jgi:ribose transport system permease protein